MLKSHLKITAALMALLAVATACESSSTTTPPEKPTSKSYNAQMLEGMNMKLNIKLPTDSSAISTAMTVEFSKLQSDLTWAAYGKGTGTCDVAAVSDDSGITTCHITAAEGIAAPSLLDHYLRFQVTEDVWMFVQIVKPADIGTVSKLYLTGGGVMPGLITSEACNDIIGKFTSVGSDPQAMSYLEFNSSTKLARHADFGFTQSGSGYTALYTTNSPDASGLENVLKVVCKGGYRAVSYEKGGTPKDGFVFETKSGAVMTTSLFSNFSFWVNSTKTLAVKTMANKKFKGTFFGISLGSLSIAVDFKVAASGTDGAMVTEYNLPTGFPPASVDALSPVGEVIRPINSASATAIFSNGTAASKTSSLNALAGIVGDASDVPGLNYADKVTSGTSAPHIFMTWKTPSGKQAVIIMHYVRKTAPTVALIGITTATEE